MGWACVTSDSDQGDRITDHMRMWKLRGHKLLRSRPMVVPAARQGNSSLKAVWPLAAGGGSRCPGRWLLAAARVVPS